LTLLKEHYIPDLGRRFQAAGFAVLVYDHRGWGSSDGEPHNATNPMQQAEDYHGAVIFARSLPNIDPSRISIWGIGHSVGASMIAAGADPFIKAAILVMPFTSGAQDAVNYPPGRLDWVRADREANHAERGTQTTFVPVWNDSVEQASGDRDQTVLHGSSTFEFISGAKDRPDTVGTPWENKMSLQSFHHIAKIEPRDRIYKIAPRPLLYLAAMTDVISGPYQVQQEVFARAGEPKEFVTLHDHHVANYFVDNFEKNVSAQIEFLKRHL
jgi:fermentation-respiration switch protein FrsA (DUF1100 family)